MKGKLLTKQDLYKLPFGTKVYIKGDNIHIKDKYSDYDWVLTDSQCNRFYLTPDHNFEAYEYIDEEEFNNKFNNIKDKHNNLREKRQKLANEEYIIRKEYGELIRLKSKQNIGRCFKKLKNNNVIAYCKVIDIDKGEIVRDSDLFNQYRYPSLWFKYPYNNSIEAFYKDNIFSGAWGQGNDITSEINGITYEEIDNCEFIEKFKEINKLWLQRISELGDE